MISTGVLKDPKTEAVLLRMCLSFAWPTPQSKLFRLSPRLTQLSSNNVYLLTLLTKQLQFWGLSTPVLIMSNLLEC